MELLTVYEIMHQNYNKTVGLQLAARVRIFELLNKFILTITFSISLSPFLFPLSLSPKSDTKREDRNFHRKGIFDRWGEGEYKMERV